MQYLSSTLPTTRTETERSMPSEDGGDGDGGGGLVTLDTALAFAGGGLGGGGGDGWKLVKRVSKTSRSIGHSLMKKALQEVVCAGAPDEVSTDCVRTKPSHVG